MPTTPKITLALSGGVGGAKLAFGLAQLLPPEELVIVCNTGDDFEHLGLPISPDLDTVMYTLSGRSNTTQGWGLADESWRVMTAVEALGGESWFRLGDQDMATHLYRLSRLKAGASLSQVTRELCTQYGVRHPVLPMSDDPVRTMVQVAGGKELPFQHYFVRERCQPPVNGFRFDGIDTARATTALIELMVSGRVGAIVICPSNPFVSVDPILGIRELHDYFFSSGIPVLAVSPIVAGRALKGPAAKMMRELGMPVTAQGVAAHYGRLLHGFVIDQSDAEQASSIASTGVRVKVAQTVMSSDADRMALARDVLTFASTLRAC